MKLLIDINVLLDLFLQREPWGGDAARLLNAIEAGLGTGYVAGHTITTAYYVVTRARGKPFAAAMVSDLLRLVEVVPAGKADFQHALGLGFEDYEDAVQTVCALSADADAIVTRDPGDFSSGPLRLLDAATALHLLHAGR